MSQSFTFDGYTVRPVKERDREYLKQLISADPYHRDCMTPDFFLNLMPGEDAWALEDQYGEVVFYFKTTTAVRIAIQFSRSQRKEDRVRNRYALMRGLHWIEGIFRRNRFREIIFDTKGPELTAFSIRRLGFTEAFLLTKTLGSMPKPPATQPSALGNFPTNHLERVG